MVNSGHFEIYRGRIALGIYAWPNGLYGCGVADSHFDFGPFARDIRVLRNGYTDDGIQCADGPVAVSRVVGIPNPIGRKAVIRIAPDALEMGWSRIALCLKQKFPGVKYSLEVGKS